MPITMDDVAKRAEVSKSTVSLALNDKPGISPDLKATIVQVAEEMGYTHPKKRTLHRRGVSPLNPTPTSENYSIGVIHAQSPQHAGNNYEPTDLYLNYLTGIKSFAEAAGLHLTVIADYNESDTQQLSFHLLHSDLYAFNGLILMGGSASQNSRVVTQILEKNMPAVALSRFWPELPISTVGPNYYQQVRLAVEHLIELGHRRIGFVAQEDDRRFEWFRWRLDAYKALMRAHVGHVDEALIAIGPNGAAAATTLLEREPDVTAIFAINDERALEVIDGVQARGLRIPQDLSVIGQDNVIELMGDAPILTTVDFPHAQVGALAAELLLQQIQNQAISHANLWVQCALVSRASCGQTARTP